MSEWQPIETAPKDLGHYLFVTVNGTIRVDYFVEGLGSKKRRWNEHPRVPYTHWMPLPEPPKHIEGKGE